MVKFEKQSGHTLRFTVVNTGHTPIIVNRDAVTLRTPTLELARVPGGRRSFWIVKAGERRLVICRFDMSGLAEGETVELMLNDALVSEGQAIAANPVRFVVGS